MTNSKEQRLCEDWQKDFVNKAFTYHAPTPDQVERYTVLRALGKEMGLMIAAMTPESVEQSQAFLHLQQVIMWANAAIAINEAVDQPRENNNDD